MRPAMKILLLVLVTACGTDAVLPVAPDIPKSPAGAFAIHSTYDVAAMPHGLVDDLVKATGDPARYLVDRIVGALPDGPIKTAAHEAEPFIAAYLDNRLDEVAPRLARGLAQAATELASIASHFGTAETLDIPHHGNAMRTITGLRFLVGSAPANVAFVDHGVADLAVPVRVVLDTSGNLTLSEHVLELSYGRLLRLGLDHAVVPSIEPSASGVAEMLRNLVDCKRVGAAVATALHVDAPSLFEAACTTGLTAAATDLDGRLAELDSVPLVLDLTGFARGTDSDHDGKMDTIDTGVWSGSARYGNAPAPLGTSTFTGARTQ